MAGNKEYVLTIEGKEQLEAEFRHLLDIDRPEVLEQLQAARAMGDLSENADYDAARNKQAQIEARIAEIEEILANVKIVDSTRKAKTIGFSSEVTFKDLETEEISTVRIVSSIEADPLKDNKISNECALGAALIGKKAGDIVSVKAVTPYNIEILEVK